MAVITKRYISIPSGQAHLRETPAVAGAPALYCLHATAYSGRTFEGMMARLAGRRRLVAPDTPGYGESDRPPERWDIPQYAAAIAKVIEAVDEGPVDLLGYHTGALIAIELAAQRQDLVRRLVLIGVPFFEGEARERWLKILAQPMTLTERLDQFDERWSFFIEKRYAGVSLEQGYANFVDELKAWPYGYWAHDVAFRYATETRAPLIGQTTLVLNPDNHLSQPSRDAAALILNGKVVELPHLNHGVLDVASAELADLADAYLREP